MLKNIRRYVRQTLKYTPKGKRESGKLYHEVGEQLQKIKGNLQRR